MKDGQVLHKKQRTLHSSLEVLGAKIEEVSSTAQQLIDDEHYASADISTNMTSLKEKCVHAYIHTCTHIQTHVQTQLYVRLIM